MSLPTYISPLRFAFCLKIAECIDFSSHGSCWSRRTSQISRLEAPGIMAFEVEKNRKKRGKQVLKVAEGAWFPVEKEKAIHSGMETILIFHLFLQFMFGCHFHLFSSILCWLHFVS